MLFRGGAAGTEEANIYALQSTYMSMLFREGERGRKKPIYMRCKACNPPLPFQGQAFGFSHKFLQSLFDSFIFFLIVCHNSVCSANLSALSVLKNWLKLIIFVRRGRFKTLHHTPQSIVGKLYSHPFSQTPHLTTVWLGLCTKIDMFILHTPANPRLSVKTPRTAVHRSVSLKSCTPPGFFSGTAHHAITFWHYAVSK